MARFHAPASADAGDRFDGQRLSVRLYVGWVVAVGALLTVVNLATLRLTHLKQAAPFVVLLGLALLSSTVKVTLPLSRSGSTMSLSYAISMTAMLLLDMRLAFLINIASAWGQCTFNMKVRNPPYRTLFSMATVGIALQAASLAFQVTRGAHTDYLLGLVQPLVPAVVAYFLLNSLLVASAVGLATRDSIRRIWSSNFLWSAPGYFAGAAAAAIAAVLAQEASYSWGILAAIPLYLTYHSYRLFLSRIEDEQAQVRQLSNVQLATIEALALAIEVKDHTSQAHVRRLQVYVEGLARAIEMTEEEIRGVKTAALLHDVGNLAVPEHILTKAGRLTDEEFERVKIHPRVGAEILASVPFPYPVASLILAHHEHWDGSGYPSGLAGDAIPPGARVLAVVDVFTALLAHRPYRAAHTYQGAVGLLREQAGRKLDPTLVETFIALLPSLNAALEDPDGASAARPAHPGGAAPALAVPTALQDIAGAHREAQALYDIAQALGATSRLDETFAVVHGKLGAFMPFTVCALFLRDDDTGAFLCSHAAGPGADAVRALTAPSVDELAGRLPAGAEAGVALRAVLACPLEFGDRVIGALALYGPSEALTANDHRRVLERVCRQAGSVVYNAIVFERAEVASRTDALTGLPNRRAAHEHIASVLDRATREGSSLSLVLLDLDGLKYLNDTFGHHMGDVALKRVGEILARHAGTEHFSCRYAGDEFVMVLAGCERRDTEARVRALQADVDAAFVEPIPGQPVALAVSAGIAVFPEDGRTEHDLVAVADQRMYGNKTARRSARAHLAAGGRGELAG
ncbi:MAG: diguanylate cyclase [Vicinamibacterales bacterium]